MNESIPKDESPTVDEKRAKYEDFSLHVCKGGVGYVNVCNHSHNDDKNHTHSVEVRDGEVQSCSCPHATYRDAHCKHQRVVEQNRLVVASAEVTTEGNKVLTDGGTTDDEIEVTQPSGEPSDENYCSKYIVPSSECVLSDGEDCPHDIIGADDDSSEEEERDYPITEAQYRNSRDKTESTGVVDLE